MEEELVGVVVLVVVVGCDGFLVSGVWEVFWGGGGWRGSFGFRVLVFVVVVIVI